MTVCQPHLEGERWQCRRPALAGGPCEAGPLPDGECCQKSEPCVPKPSLRTVRKRVAMWASALCVGLVALMLGSEKASDFLMPGPLTSLHASLTDCRTCHAGVEPDNLGWLHNFAAGVKPEDNAKLCIGCHNAGATMFSPHTNPIDQLRQLTARYNAGDTSRPVKRDSLLHRIAAPVSNMTSAPGQTKIFCATCHQEHQGTVYDLTTMSNDRCQTCHTSKFGSFAASHPEYSSYPFDRRTRIIFDHKNHFGKHFPKTKETGAADQFVPSLCADCHRLDAGKNYMEVRTYDSMCAGCHDDEIKGTTRASGSKGIDFLAVPGLDVAALAGRGVDIGEWPENSEAELTGFLRALIVGEPKGADIVTGVSQLDLLDLADASDEELGHVKALAWTVKKIFSRLESTPLSQAMTTMPDTPEGTKVDLFTGLMPRDVIIMGNHEWFPNLKDDLERFRTGKPTKGFAAPGQPLPSEPEQLEPKPVEGEGEILPESDDAILGGKDDDLEGSDILGEKDDDLEGSDILGEKDGDLEGSDILGEKEGILEGSDALARDDDAKDDALTALDETSQPERRDGEAKSGDKPSPQFDAESWAAYGGWYRQDFTIRFRPYGHSARFLRTWLDYSGQAFGTGLETVLAPIFNQLAGRGAVGRCTKCHSVDNVGGSKLVKWRAYSPRQVKNRFTTFSHEPHISASGNKGCMLCHKPRASDVNYLKTYADGLAGIFEPNFTAMDKAVCSSCHTQQIAGETCTLCHNYHVTEFNPMMTKSKLP